MIPDAPDLLRDYLQSKSLLTDLTATRIWPEETNPPTGYKPSQGAGIAFRSREERKDGGGGLLYNSWQFRCFAADKLAANRLYRVLVSVLDDSNFSGWPGIAAVLLEHKAGTLETPDNNGWPYVLCYFQSWIQIYRGSSLNFSQPAQSGWLASL